MRIDVKLFAVAKQLAGAETVCLELAEAAKVKDLRAALGEQYPVLSDVIRHGAFAINTEYVDDETTIPHNAEVACIPPVSGG